MALEKNPQWAKGINTEAKVIRRTHAVLAHGVRTTIDTTKQEALIARLQEENKRLHPGLEIVRAAWPKNVVDSGKSHSSLILEVATAAMANRLIDHGVIESYRELDCEYFAKEARTIQCFNCHKFGHPAKLCRNPIFCHKCGESHDPNTCETTPERMHCAECAKEGHKPWMRRCPKWKETKEKVRGILKNRPLKYREDTRGQQATPTISPETSSSATAVPSRESSATRPTAITKAVIPYTPVTLGKRKGGAGPPLTTPAKRGRPPIRHAPTPSANTLITTMLAPASTQASSQAEAPMTVPMDTREENGAPITVPMDTQEENGASEWPAVDITSPPQDLPLW